MANALGENLKGRYVVLRESAVAPRYHHIKWRVFKVTGGFASSFTAGSALFGESPYDGEKWRADGPTSSGTHRRDRDRDRGRISSLTFRRTDRTFEVEAVLTARWISTTRTRRSTAARSDRHRRGDR